MNKHIPVLLNEVLEILEPASKAGSVFVDCTLGGAGHTSALLENNPELKLLSCDVDIAAIEAAKERLSNPFAEGRLQFFHGNFANLVDHDPLSFPEGFQSPWDGVLMDLGYSSNQLEDTQYGMSFLIEGPLDMRLSRDGQSAWELMKACTAEELGEILAAYGEMPGSFRVARKICEAVANGEIQDSTTSLAGFMERISGGRKRGKIHPATLVFQALRIAVNDELRVLDHFLEGVILRLKPSARIAVITFHSLEDRITKRWGQKNAQRLRAVTKKPIVASEEEIKLNPRSRSAKLRVYERIP